MPYILNWIKTNRLNLLIIALVLLTVCALSWGARSLVAHNMSSAPVHDHPTTVSTITPVPVSFESKKIARTLSQEPHVSSHESSHMSNSEARLTHILATYHGHH